MLQVHLASTRAIGAIGAEQDRAEARVRNLTKTVLLEAQDAPPQARAAAAGPTSDLDGRLRYIAPPLSCHPATGGAAVPGDGQPGAGLRGATAADFVVLDGQALAELAVGARTVGEP